MEKKEIISRFLEIGVVIPPDVLKRIDETNIDKYLNAAKKNGKIFFMEDEKPEKKDEEKKSANPEKQKINIEIKKPEKKTRLTPNDFIQYYNEKYNGLKNILLKKINAVSISNARKGFSELSVIGMVKELKPEGFVLEDPTGIIEVNSKKPVSEDDVIGIRGFVRNNILFEKEIIYPDVPITNPIGRMNASLIITPRKNQNAKADIVVTHEETKPNPTWILLSKGNEKITILAYKPGNKTTKEDAVNYLKKRHLNPKRNMIISEKDWFIIDPVPDIFWLKTKNRFLESYKGVTLLSVGEGSFAEINLKTRNVVFHNI